MKCQQELLSGNTLHSNMQNFAVISLIVLRLLVTEKHSFCIRNWRYNCIQFLKKTKNFSHILIWPFSGRILIFQSMGESALLCQHWFVFILQFATASIKFIFTKEIFSENSETEHQISEELHCSGSTMKLGQK